MALNINEARKLVLDLGKPNENLYLADFLLSYILGVLGFVLAYPQPLGSAAFWSGLTMSILGLYRAMSFTHEIAHFRQRLPRFRFVWNALAGMPMAFPSFMYTGSHAIHHNPRTYGTAADGEYIPFHIASRWQIVLYLASSFWTPPLLILRFALLFPLSLLIAPLRKLLVERGSSVVITLHHVAEWPKESEKTEWLVMETACAVFWWTVFAAYLLGTIPTHVFTVGYLAMSGALFLNGMRTLAAHRFAGDGRVMSIEEQLLDSVNIVAGFPGWILSALAAPAGLRFHALHHLFPFIPYHSLGEAHRRLAAKLPPESSYHQSGEPGILIAFAKLWRREPVPSPTLAIKDA